MMGAGPRRSLKGPIQVVPRMSNKFIIESKMLGNDMEKQFEVTKRASANVLSVSISDEAKCYHM